VLDATEEHLMPSASPSGTTTEHNTILLRSMFHWILCMLTKFYKAKPILFFRLYLAQALSSTEN